MARTRLVMVALLLCGAASLAQAQPHAYAGGWDFYVDNPYALTGEEVPIRALTTDYGLHGKFTCPTTALLKGFAGLSCPPSTTVQTLTGVDPEEPTVISCLVMFVCKGSNKPGWFKGSVDVVLRESSAKLKVNVEAPQWGVSFSPVGEVYERPYTKMPLQISVQADHPYNTTSCGTNKATLVGFEGLGCPPEAPIGLLNSGDGGSRPTCNAVFDCTGTPTPGTFNGTIAAAGSFSSDNLSITIVDWVPPPPPPPPSPPFQEPVPSATGLTVGWVPSMPGTSTPVNVSIKVDLDEYWQMQVGPGTSGSPVCPGAIASLTGFEGLGCPTTANLTWSFGLYSYGWPTTCTAETQCRGSSTPGNFTGTVTVTNLSRTLTISIAPPPVFKALPTAVPSNCPWPVSSWPDVFSTGSDLCGDCVINCATKMLKCTCRCSCSERSKDIWLLDTQQPSMGCLCPRVVNMCNCVSGFVHFSSRSGDQGPVGDMACADQPHGSEPNWFDLAAKAGALPNIKACYPYKQCTYPVDGSLDHLETPYYSTPGGFSTSPFSRYPDCEDNDDEAPRAEAPEEAPEEALPEASGIAPGEARKQETATATSQVPAGSGTDLPAVGNVPTDIKVDPPATIQIPEGPSADAFGSGKAGAASSTDLHAAIQVPSGPSAATEDVVAAPPPASPTASDSLTEDSVTVGPGSPASQALSQAGSMSVVDAIPVTQANEPSSSTSSSGGGNVMVLEVGLAEQHSATAGTRGSDPSSSRGGGDGVVQVAGFAVQSSTGDDGTSYRLGGPTGAAGSSRVQGRSAATRASVAPSVYCWTFGAVLVMSMLCKVGW